MWNVVVRESHTRGARMFEQLSSEEILAVVGVVVLALALLAWVWLGQRRVEKTRLPRVDQVIEDDGSYVDDWRTLIPLEYRTQETVRRLAHL
jgi:hypothetical protein